MNRSQNHQTQPFHTMRVFNNWSTIAPAWYAVCRSRDLARGAVKGVDVGKQHLVVFRGEDGQVRALDGFCPHMGTDLAIGRVQGNQLQCFFHHWTFDGTGACRDIPASDKIPPNACTQGWAARDVYGMIWVFPDLDPPFDIPTFPDLTDHDVIWRTGRAYRRNCHHHVCMINGIDVQHLATVHGIAMDVGVTIEEDPDQALIDFTIDGKPPSGTLLERLVSRMLGGRYSYHMRYSGASLGLLTTTRDVRLLGVLPIPRTRMLFGYQPLPDGTTMVWPVFLSDKRGGLMGRMLAEFLLFSMYLGFLVLRDADGMIYDNIRFQPSALLAQDKPLGRFFAYVNRLGSSPWTPVRPDE